MAIHIRAAKPALLLLAGLALAGAIAGFAPAGEPEHKPATPPPNSLSQPPRVTKPGPVAPKAAPKAEPAEEHADADKSEKAEPADKAEKTDKTEKAEKAEKPQKADKSDKTEKAEKPQKGDKTVEAKRAAKPASAVEVESVNADLALDLLEDGNARWVSGKIENPNIESARRAELADKGQKPFATILTCSDSRVPVERVFDRGIGDLFVVRVAGNTPGTSEGGTIEYGVEHLHTPVLVVMGHTKCGAVAAAASKASLPGQIGQLVESIKPAVERARVNNPDLDDKALAVAAVRENVWQSIFGLLRNSPVLRDKVRSGELKIVGALYNISEGKVEFMGPHPWQAELVAAFEAREKKREEASAEPAVEAHPR